MKPIPDAVLREMADNTIRGITLTMIGEPMTCPMYSALESSLARELLALRAAAKFAWGGLKDIEEGRDGPGEKWCAEACRNIEELLPESAGAEGGEGA